MRPARYEYKDDQWEKVQGRDRHIWQLPDDETPAIVLLLFPLLPTHLVPLAAYHVKRQRHELRHADSGLQTEYGKWPQRHRRNVGHGLRTQRLEIFKCSDKADG